MNDMQKAIQALSISLENKEADRKKLSGKLLDELILELSEKHQLKRADDQTLEKVKSTDGLLTVDASYHRMGGAAPHFVEIYKAVGLSTGNEAEKIEEVRIHTPVLEADDPNFAIDEKSSEAEKRLAEIELDVALELVEKKKGYALVMDGSLIRFAILVPEKWEALREKCKQREIPLLGVIEDIKTKHLGTAAVEKGLCTYTHYDREILMGKLAKGECLLLHKTLTGKSVQGLSTLFARLAAEPFVIGIDFDGEDEKKNLEITEILYAITPKRGRGIPYLLDWVDTQARFSEDQWIPYFKKYGNIELMQTYFVSQRNKRSR